MRWAGLLVVLVGITARPAWAQTTTTITTSTTTTTLPTIPPTVLCTCSNNQCLVTGNTRLSPGSIDFGTCALVLDTGATVTLSSPGALQIRAGSLTLNPYAAITDSGGRIVVNVPGTINLGNRSTIDVSTLDAITAVIDLTAGGAVTLTGSLGARATDSTGSGGTVNVTAGGRATPGDVVIDERITVRGGGQGTGGSVCITAQNGVITVNAPIDATGGEFDGGCIDLEADGDLVVNNNATGVTLDVSGGGLSGFGGLIVANSNVAGNVTINAPLLGGAGGSTTEGGGDGGELDMSTNLGNIVVNAPLTVKGGSNGGRGGTVDLEPTGDLTVTQPLLVSGTGAGAVGGDVTLSVTGVATLSSVIDVSATGNQARAGSVSLDGRRVAGATANLLAMSEIKADSAPGTLPRAGGSIDIVDQTSTVDGFVHANGGGGSVNLQACSLAVSAAAKIQADGTGTNLLQASGPMQILGTLRARTNTLDYLDPANTPSTAGASITPAATIVQNNPVFSPLCPGPTTAGGACMPPRCDDRGLCEPGTCVGGQCEYMLMVGLDGVSCRLNQMQGLLETAPPSAIHSHALRRKLLAKLAKLGRLVQRGRSGGRRSSKALRQGDHGLAAFRSAVGAAARGGKLDAGLAASVMGLATDAKAALDPIVAHP